MLTSQELREMSQVRISRTIGSLVFDWGFIALSFAAFIYWPSILVFVCAFLVMSRMQLGLAILMHDAAHKRLVKSVRWSDFIGQFLCAAPLFFSLYSYRTLHLKHHQDPLAEDDPDLSLIGGYPISRKSFYRKLLRDAFGISYIKFIKYFIHMSRKPKPAKKPNLAADAQKREKVPALKIAVSILWAHGFLLGTLVALGHPWLYLTLWFLPAITALQVLLRVRGIAEHAGYQQNADQKLNARTVKRSLQTLIFAPHNVNYHIEHHVYRACLIFASPNFIKKCPTEILCRPLTFTPVTHPSSAN